MGRKSSSGPFNLTRIIEQRKYNSPKPLSALNSIFPALPKRPQLRHDVYIFCRKWKASLLGRDGRAEGLGSWHDTDPRDFRDKRGQDGWAQAVTWSGCPGMQGHLTAVRLRAATSAGKQQVFKFPQMAGAPGEAAVPTAGPYGSPCSLLALGNELPSTGDCRSVSRSAPSR